MATGYMSRMLRAGVGRQLHPEPPLPTKADFCAQIFDQEWASHIPAQSLTRFAVLALDHAHARLCGERRIERLFGIGAIAEMRLVASVPRTWIDAVALADVLAIETREDCEERQARFEAQESAGERP